MSPDRTDTHAYDVFARHDKDRALSHIGEVQAGNGADAVVFARTLYVERRWQEMFVVPRSAVIRLIRPE